MKTPLFARFAAVLVGLLLLTALGCDFQKTQNQLTARSVIVATVLSTPPVELKPWTLVGFDAGADFDGGLVFPDGGFTFDAGDYLDAGVLIPAQSAVFLFFGQRQGEALDSPPTGTPGATVTIAQVGGGSWPVAEQSGGNYLLLGSDAGFEYQSNATYELRVVLQGQTYVAEVKDVPALENIAQFHPPQGFVSLAANTPFTFTRPDPPSGQDRNLGFVSVYPVDSQGQQGTPSWTNIPKTPLDFLKLVVAPLDWKGTTVTVPGEAFPEAGKNYVVVLQAAKLGGPQSDNVFSGSAIIAGTADVAVIQTK